jgi:hypothetical protein
LGQTGAGLAIGTGVEGAGWQSVGGTPSEPAGNGLAAGVVGIENLGEEDGESDEGREEAVAEGDGLIANSLFGEVSG